MKNEKLELLLNKVVEYNQPTTINSNGCHFKGFLYYDWRGYYIKVIEYISGKDITVDDKVYLKENEEQYIIHADKPKLMKVSLKSWHYKLMKFVLRGKTPTPQTLQNGCPYFWLLVFSLFACTFVAIWEVAKFTFLLIPKGFIWCLEQSVNAWIMSVDDVEAYEIYNNKYHSRKDEQKLPITAKIFLDAKDEEFFNYFLSKKYGITARKNKKEYDLKYNEINAQWKIWKAEIFQARQKRDAERRVKEAAIAQKEYDREIIREKNRLKWEARMRPIKDDFKVIFTTIRKTFTFKGDTKSLIKRTKQIVGVIITILLLAISYLLINGLAFALMFLIDICIKNWDVFAILGFIGIAGGIIYALSIFVWGWIEKLINKYNTGKKIWYIEPFIYLFYYPIKYIIFAIGYFLLYIIWKPIKFIFYDFLWKIVLINFGVYGWKMICAFGRGLANSTGVFGEYFNASYTDYCPGIEWVDVDEEKK